MNLQDVANYVIILYGICVPIYFSVRSITIKMLIDRKERQFRESLDLNTSPKPKYMYKKQQQSGQERIRDIVYDDNKSTNQRITELKRIVR